ncbi:hypothetical protein [Halalkalibacter oceani]|uniref:hypothetical protein n=1 Tax=Halalkalibacter oceani TaxID=1653776 RepID=UPI00203B68F9|nr:hypothetical protein [Halalkalibacter oceani]
MGRRFRHFPPPPRPRLWWKIRAICLQIFVPLICFQLIRTFFLPTTFDVILLTLMIVFYCSLRLDLF